jgi:hypothetical protein
VSSRGKAKKKAIVPRRDVIRALILVVLVAGVPILGTILVTASTSEPDLSDLTPIHERAGKYLVLDWSALLQDRPRLPKTGTVIPAGADVQALGYMMDGDRSSGKDKWVQHFVLLPETGSLLHPPHRMRDQMIAVHLEHDARIQFSPGALVWAWGNLQASAGLGPRSEALYMLERARAKPADKADIQRHFK